MSNNPFYVQSAGNPAQPAIVFLHGAGLSSRQWTPQLAALAADFYCLAPDLPEQGQTPGPFDLQAAVEGVAALIRAQVPTGKAHVVGLSLGGAVALEVLRQHPDCVQTMLVTGTSGPLTPLLGRVMIWSAGLGKLMPAAWLANAAIKQFGIEPQRALVYDDLLRAGDPGFNRRVAQSLMTHCLPEQSGVPLLVLVGGQETAAAKAAARGPLSHIPRATGRLVPGVGHVWNLQAPDLFNAVVRAWVTQIHLPATLQSLS
jgi:pimeloyl-ACP methyl ester carboxylesterase